MIIELMSTGDLKDFFIYSNTQQNLYLEWKDIPSDDNIDEILTKILKMH